MARWIKITMRMSDQKELELAERLNLPRENVTSSFNPIVIDAEKILAYCEDVEDGEETGYSEIALVNGGTVITDIPFDKLDKIIRNGDK